MNQVIGSAPLSHTRQTEVTRIVALAGQILQQYGAETKIIEQTSARLGKALGCESVEIAISATAIVITTLYEGRCITTTRRIYDRGINMQMVCDVQRICIMTERGVLHPDQVKMRLSKLKPMAYNRWWVVVMIGLSCASFSQFFGGDGPVYWVTFFASSVAMFVRQEVAKRHHNPLVNFGLTAFVATALASLGPALNLGERPHIAMAACVLLLVPGFPLINAVSDMVKGYVNMGIARWTMATLLAISASIGIVLAMAVTGVKGWL